MRGRAFLAAALLALLAAPSGARAAPAARDFPCAGCLLRLPPNADRGPPRALLVVLHGDEGSPAMIGSRFAEAALGANMVLLAPRCPRDRGCTSGSFWRWGGDPAWLTEQVDAVKRAVPIDPGRVYLAGWSGGASYMGLAAPALRGFSALDFNGGGLPPAPPAACPRCPPAIYFLAGDRNPLHPLAVEAREYLRGCGAELLWDLLPGRDHAGELRALSPPKVAAILAWMEAHHARCDEPAAATPKVAPAASAPVAAPPLPAPPPAPPPPSDLRAVAPAPAAVSRCGCALPGARANRPPPLALLAAALAARRGRRLARAARRRDLTAPAPPALPQPPKALAHGSPLVP